MSISSPITRAYEWHRFEHKDLRISVTDDQSPPLPVDLIAHNLRFILKNRPLSETILLTKTTESGITLDGEHEENIAVVEIEVADYENLPPDLYYYELWDDSDELQLSFGRALLQPGTELAEAS